MAGSRSRASRNPAGTGSKPLARASSIDKLPAEVKDLIVDLRKQGVSIEDILGRLREMGAAVSHSALGRHTKELDAMLRDAMEAREFGRALKKDWEQDGDDALPAANEEFLQVALFKMHMAVRRGEAANFEVKEMLALSRTTESLARSRRLNLDTQIKIRQRAEQKTKDAAVKAVEKKGPSKGLSRETIEFIKAEILGVEVT